MLNHSSPSSPNTINILNYQNEKEIITFNNKSPSIYEGKQTFTSRNHKSKILEDDMIIQNPNSPQKKAGTFNPKSGKKENENITKKNNSLYNEQQSESIVIRENSGKLTISDLNNINNKSINSVNKNTISLSNNKNINNNENINIEVNEDEDGEENNEEDNNEYNNEEMKINDMEEEGGGNEEQKLEDFLIENNNKNIISQKENEFLLYDMNNTINNSINNEDKNNSIDINFNVNEVQNKNNEENKINFFIKILDIEILIDTKEIYSRPWSQLINNIYNKCELNNDSIQLISLGSQHTLCLSNRGKLFSFGWNNYSQCGKKSKKNEKGINYNLEIEKIEELNEINMEQKINDISSGEDHSLIISEQGKIFGFGLNNKGQLCYDPSKHEVISKPSLIKSFKRFFISNAQCTNSISLILNNKGEAFICPWEDKHNQLHYIPFKLFFPYKPKIITISCGDNFSIFLSEKGNIYSMGSNNKYGQLGLGDTNIQLSPKIIPFFKKNKIKISQISCGYCHVLSLSEKGNVYSWGMGGEGQLGLGDEISVSYIPKLIDYFKNNNLVIFQVSSGFHSSYFLTEKNNIYICGTNGRDCNKEFIPKIIDPKMKYKDLIKYPCWICRILNCWNRSMSVFYAIFLDCHFINKDDEEVNKILNLISKKWVHQSFSSSIMKGIDSMNYT